MCTCSLYSCSFPLCWCCLYPPPSPFIWGNSELLCVSDCTNWGVGVFCGPHFSAWTAPVCRRSVSVFCLNMHLEPQVRPARPLLPAHWLLQEVVGEIWLGNRSEGWLRTETIGRGRTAIAFTFFPSSERKKASPPSGLEQHTEHYRRERELFGPFSVPLFLLLSATARIFRRDVYSDVVVVFSPV